MTDTLKPCPSCRRDDPYILEPASGITTPIGGPEADDVMDWVGCGGCSFNASIKDWQERTPDEVELAACREQALREAARTVCGYCSGHFPSFARKAIGPNASGNYTHTRNDVSDVVLCVASSIYILIAEEAAVSARATKEKP